ncbi:MAG: DNA polymerase I [Candidatus Aphodosoma sp.]
MDKLYLVDAYALIFRAYYAFIRAPRINSKGMNTSAVFGFLNTFEEIVRRENPEYMAVVFDPAGPTFRHEQFESYKANRDATPEDIHAAVPFIKDIMAAYGVNIVQVPGYEADDVIGTLAVQAAAKGFDVFMVTPDKDYGQLVSGHISIIKPRNGQSDIEVLGPAEVTARWGIESPEQVADLLGLMGDSADNIPGCPGVGEKTAVRLINRFGSVENLLEHAGELTGALKTKITGNIQQIRDSKYLATICTDVPVSFNAGEYAVAQRNVAELIRIFTELEFKTHIARLTDNAGAKPEKEPSLFGGDDGTLSFDAHVPTALENKGSVAHDYKIVETVDETDALISRLEAAQSVGIAIVTTTPESMTCRLLGMAFAVAGHEAAFVPVSDDSTEAKNTVARFSRIFSSGKIKKIGHNLKHQMIVLHRYGAELDGELFDNEIAHYLLQPDKKHGIAYLAQTVLNYSMMSDDETGMTKGRKQLPKTELADCACESADVSLSLHAVLEAHIDEAQLTDLFVNVEMPLAGVLARMEMTGVLIDDFALSQISEQLTVRMNRIESNIRAMVNDRNINISSPKQVGELLFGTLKLSDNAHKTKRGQYTTDEETLEALRHKHPVVGEILEYRGLKKLLGTYVDALPRLINPGTGKVHTSFNQTVTVTGRLSSSNPNLQNIPVRNDHGKLIRRAFIASDGCVFLSADYSQVELRIMAHLSGDSNLIQAFQADHDIHAATAANIYHIPIGEVDDDMRRKAKTANFGIIYGISAFGLAERLNIPRSEAKDLIAGYFATFPKVREYIDNVVERARVQGYVETLMHRRRYLQDINSRNATVRGYAERNAVNAPIQGTAADIIKVAMVRIDRRLREEGLKTRMILQVHDELDFDVPVGEIDTVAAIVRHEMESAFALSVPLKVDLGTGSDWLEAH